MPVTISAGYRCKRRVTDGEQFTQLSGEDPSSLGHRAMGGAGCISVTANVAPDLCAQMHAAFDADDLATDPAAGTSA